jgi:flagellar assembly protein FliH
MKADRNITFSAPVLEVKLARSGPRDTLLQQDLKSSFERGRIEGERSLSAQLVQQRSDVMELQTGVLAALREAVPQVARDCERALVMLALEAAQRLVSGLPISHEMIEASVKEACAQVEDSAELNVQLHPDDLALLEKVNSPLLFPQGGIDRIHFHSSAQVTRGGCLVQTRFGVVDARRETKVELLKAALSE